MAFGALGIPVTTLAKLTGLPVMSLSAMMGRQLPLVSFFLPLYAMLFFAGERSLCLFVMEGRLTKRERATGPRAGVLECWPPALVAGLSFAVIQAIFSNLVGPELPDLIAGLVSLLSVIIFVQYWKPKYRPEYALTFRASHGRVDDEEAANVRSAARLQAESSNNGANSIRSAADGNEKMEVSHDQDENSDASGSKQEQEIVDPTAVVPISELVKPTWLEAVVAWSPWVLIIVVVIM